MPHSPLTRPRPQLDAAAVRSLAAAVDADALITSPDALEAFRDPFGDAGSGDHLASAVVEPSCLDQVRDIVRIATEHSLTLWPFSQGRNNAYGGCAPRTSGTVLVSLRRMNRILDVDERRATALVEPGVRFSDMYAYLRDRGHRLWSSAPDLGWGSIVGNALEHGIGYTVHGEHASRICGLEVVLADGDVLRTGLGAMSASPGWQVHPRGFGPTADGLFKQSNFGIVTKMGIWLMPEPESYLSGVIQVPRREDLAPLIDAVRPLFIHGIIQNHAGIGHPAFVAGVMDGAPSRREIYDGPGPVPEEAVLALTRSLGIGRWNMRFALYGTDPIVRHRFAMVRDAVSHIEGVQVTGEQYAGHEVHTAAQDQNSQVQAGIPGMGLMRALDWYSGPGGGHYDFSLVAPLQGHHVQRIHAMLDRMMAGTGLDWDPAMIVGPRFLINIAQIYFPPGNEEITARAYRLYPQLIREGGALGYAPYRTHLDVMDVAAEQFDFGDHALLRFNERLKDALDPAGILAPGKQGIWPAGSPHRKTAPAR